MRIRHKHEWSWWLMVWNVGSIIDNIISLFTFGFVSTNFYHKPSLNHLTTICPKSHEELWEEEYGQETSSNEIE